MTLVTPEDEAAAPSVAEEELARRRLSTFCTNWKPLDPKIVSVKVEGAAIERVSPKEEVPPEILKLLPRYFGSETTKKLGEMVEPRRVSNPPPPFSVIPPEGTVLAVASRELFRELPTRLALPVPK